MTPCLTLPLIDPAAPDAEHLMPLPAVAAVIAGGRVTLACPIARIGTTPQDARVMMLVPKGVRDNLACDMDEALAESRGTARSQWLPCTDVYRPLVPAHVAGTHRDMLAALDTHGDHQQHWCVAEYEWVDPAWLCWVCLNYLPADHRCATTRLLALCATAACEAALHHYDRGGLIQDS